MPNLERERERLLPKTIKGLFKADLFRYCIIYNVDQQTIKFVNLKMIINFKKDNLFINEDVKYIKGIQCSIKVSKLNLNYNVIKKGVKII